MRARTLFTSAVVAAATALIFTISSSAALNPVPVKVMTRNVYLGADLKAGIHSKNLQELTDAAGVILSQIDRNNFPVRARGLAAEILKKKPDLVGLQEVILLRTAPCTENPKPPEAKHVRYDYLKLLMSQLNKSGKKYRVVVAEPQFDFETWVNRDGNESTAKPGCPFGSELNGRLTLRDVILARSGTVKTSKPAGAHFKRLLQLRPAGVVTNITRGWTKTDATIHGKHFRFVNTHLESFDDQANGNPSQGGKTFKRGQIREAQARELFASGGPARSKGVVVLAGDLNSDKATERKPGDARAYKALLAAGFVERSTSKPLSCCIKAHVLGAQDGGKTSDFDHKVDHVMTNSPKHISLVSSAVTGRQPVNGFWSSDHAGLFSSLSLH